MLKNFSLLCALVAADIFGMESEKLYKLMPNYNHNEPVTEQNVTKFLKVVDRADPATFAVAYSSFENYAICPATKKSYNAEIQTAVVDGLGKLNVPCCILDIIDDHLAKMLQELVDKVKSYLKKPKDQFPENLVVYLLWNGENRGIEFSRNTAIGFACAFGMKYACFLDSDDIPHVDLFRFAYSTMEQNPNVTLFLLENGSVGVRDSDWGNVQKLSNKPFESTSFNIISLKSMETEKDKWSITRDKLLHRFFSVKTSGYPPFVARVRPNMTYYEVTSTNWGQWITSYCNRNDITVYSLKLLDPCSPLYFYRLYEKSHSHRANINELTVLKEIIDLLQLFDENNRHESINWITAGLYGGIGLVPGFIDFGIGFDPSKLPNDITTIIPAAKLSRYVSSVCTIAKTLCDGGSVEDAEKAVETLLNDANISQIRALSDILYRKLHTIENQSPLE